MENEEEIEDRDCVCTHPESSHDERGCGQFINELLGDCECEKFSPM